MALFRRLNLKAGDQILTQKRGRGLTPQPKLTKKVKEDPNLMWDIEEKFLKELLELGNVFYLWKASSQKYLPIYFDDLTATIEV